jgi:type II secretory pathway component PulK
LSTDPHRQRKGGERGSALLIVLWSVMILAFAVAMTSERVALILGDTSIEVCRYQAELLADSALVSSKRILKEERNLLVEQTVADRPSHRPLDLNHFSGPWASPRGELNGGQYWIEIRDEGSRINWLKTPSSVWRTLFRMAEVPSEKVDGWLDALADWQDADDARALNGAETVDYQNRKSSRYCAKNAAVTEMGELPWLMGGDDILSLRVPVDSRGKTAGLWPMTTIDGDGRININTAPAVLIAAALNMPLEQAEGIVRSRWGPDGTPGTADDLFFDQVPIGNTTAAEKAGNETAGDSGGRASSVATAAAKLFRVRGVGVFHGQKVVRETLAVKDGEFGLRFLREAVTVEDGSHSMDQAL